MLVASGINLFDTADSYGKTASSDSLKCWPFSASGHLFSAAPIFTSPSSAAGTGKLNGRSEQLLGQFLAEYPGSQQAAANVRIATKLAAYPWRLAPSQVRT